MTKSLNILWTRTHLLVALNLYCKTPFGQFNSTNSTIVQVATLLGRTPGSLAMKLSNLASLDSLQQARGIRGLSGASQKDRDLWNDFQANQGAVAAAAEKALDDLMVNLPVDEITEPPSNAAIEMQMDEIPAGATEVISSVRVRRGQQFFRQTILNIYGNRCCISGINVTELLVASHIRPWSTFPDSRLDPRNGLCLSRLHDAAFDTGLITLDLDFRIILSKRLRSFFPQTILEQSFLAFAGSRISMPEKLVNPDSEALRYHREAIFKGI